MRAAFEYFKAFNKQDAEDNRKFAAHKLPMPVLVIAGDKAMGGAIEIQAKIVADNVTANKIYRYRTLADGRTSSGNQSCIEEIF